MNMQENKLAKRNDKKSLIFYIFLLLVFISGIWAAATIALPILSPDEMAKSNFRVGTSAFATFTEGVQHHLGTTIGLLLLQIIVILSVARGIGILFSKLKQPTVVGEIVAGILLGPTLLGAVWPEGFAFLFPESSLGSIELLSQFGLILFMFTIGMELNISDIRKQARNALIISQSGIFIPFVLGIVLCIATYTRYASEVPFLPLALFMGISMSITAFPVLARIIQERSMTRTPLGKLALNTAAAGDIIAWLLLAGIMAITQSGSFNSAIFNFLFLLLYLIVAFGILRPLFSIIGRIYNKQELISKSIIGLIFILLLVSAYVTEILSMHALFGSFILGLIMPEDVKFRHILTEKVEDVSLNVFLPLFFASSGLRTELGLINTPELWLLLILFIAVAIIGKIGGTYLSARICGLEIKESLYLGAYMNTRGLMELVVLKIGLDLGVLPPVFFAILVLMTLVTTLMTAPLIHLIDTVDELLKKRKGKLRQISQRILLAFGRSDTGPTLLRLAHQVFSRKDLSNGLSLLHITMSYNISVIDEETFFEENFEESIEEGKRLSLNVHPIHKVSDQATSEIIHCANNGEHKFLLVGAGLNLSDSEIDKSIISEHQSLQKFWGKLSVNTPEALLNARTMFNDKMARFAEDSKCSLGVFVNRRFSNPRRILVACSRKEDTLLLPYAQNMASLNKGTVSLLPLLLTNSDAAELSSPSASVHLLPPSKSGIEIAQYEFMFICYETWSLLTELRPEVLTNLPSVLIVHPK